MNIYMNPNPHTFETRKNKPSDGIRRVVEETSTRLRKMGWRFTKGPKSAAITVGHACSIDNPDVLHCHGLHPTADHSISNPPWAWETNRRVLEAVRRARYVSTPSPWVADIFARDLGFRPIILRHGISLGDWPEPGGRDSRKIVLWNKNRDRGVCDPEPIQILAQEYPKTQFVSTFGQEGSNLKVTGLVSHNKMKDLLYRTIVYFAPTKETFGIGVLEALAAGCPVLAWDWGHTPHLVRHEIDGYIVDPDDHDATSEGLLYCLDNWERLSKSARERAGKFDWDSVVKLYDAVYKEALKPREGPKVSFVIPCYNYEGFVAEAIASVKLQVPNDWECIVVDDGSKDDSLGIIRTSTDDDRRFRVFTQPNSGVAAARNRGAVESKGEYLVFLDADDRLRPNFLKRLLPVIESDPLLGIVYGKLGILRDGRVHPGTWPGRFQFDRQLAGHNQIPATNIIRRKAFMRSGGFRQRLAPVEDAELWTRLGLLGWDAQLATEDIVYDYRIHGPSASSGTRSSQKREPDWRGWLPGSNGGPQPAASIKHPVKISHPVRNYDRPDVTIVVPVGDGHELLVQDAIDSVAAQTHPNWELLVVDDTTDGGLANFGIIPYHSAHPYVGWLRCGKRNVSIARNLGAAAAKGRYLCFLDADDILLKDFLRETIPAIEEEGPCMVYTDWMELPKNVHHRAEEFTLSRLRGQALFAVTFLHLKSAWEEVGGFDAGLQGWEDWDYTIALAVAGHCGVHIPLPLIGYRYNTGSRREHSLKLKDKLLKRIFAKWKDVEPMACKGCGRRRRRVQPPQSNPKLAARRPPNWTPPPRAARAVRPVGAGLIEVEYIGRSAGARLFTCPSGNRYRFGAGRHSRKLVRREDAEHLGRFRDFLVIEPVAPQIVPREARRAVEVTKPVVKKKVMEEKVEEKVVEAQAVEEPSIQELIETPTTTPPPTDGLDVLTRVPKVTRGNLAVAGWTLERIAAADVTDLMPVRGIGPVRAQAIIDQAREVVLSA